MIRQASSKNQVRFENLYEGSAYKELPTLVKWAIREAPERVLVLEEGEEILASVYTMVCGYGNLWSSYLAFKDEKWAKRLIDHLLQVRKMEKARNLYLFCPKEYVDVRVHLILRGFIPECFRKVGGLDHIIKSYDGSFNPEYQIQKPLKQLPISLREGKSNDEKALAEIMHRSLKRDFPTIEDATRCIKKWLREMPEYTIVAEHNAQLVGVILLSPEIYPILDESLAMLCYIAVDSQYRGRGIGKSLVKEACQVLRSKGKHSMEVDVSVHNIPARIFYTKAGFYPFWFSKSYMPHDNGIFYRIDF